MVDGFDLAHLHEPVSDVLSCGGQHLCEKIWFRNLRARKYEVTDSVPVVLGLAEDGIKILDASHNAHGHFPSVGGSLGARVQGGPETLADLLDACLQLVTLEEDDENALVHLVTLEIEPYKFRMLLEKLLFCYEH